MERITVRLDSWKAALLSKGGRLTLLKSTLASIPNYFLPLFTILGSVANGIEAKFRNFLWNDVGDHHRYHLVDWKIICRSLFCGGLGIRSIKDHNRAMLAKWFWRFGMERDSLWRRVVVARYGEISPWESKEVRFRHGCGVWKSIQKIKEGFWNFIRFNLRSGRKIKFWKDRWIGDYPLRDVFRNIHSSYGSHG